ncbi:NUDIX hydrolase [Beutenbergia cavernae DSM 12333]|uniref:NUDIX hydrolase n=1 Tax=Beutenbergia cavernae (strain ATCC BAA-8 / DSM 12333 / CCUG 43141 / JCM 11478 / NBRC 16432 / NCIMB 13614 / HKI 0122) TaxID=471853 RepID=C5C394_BEUC1|nr:NUDIX domain-containing protein [Beutenbergia cavernae]ACQ79793.1 NUDIX hydrolase [Beutenbergia cavernae DSM 12333]
MHFSEYDTRLAAYAVIVDESGGAERILLTWFNGGTSGLRPCWSLPGGGVEYDESLEEAVVREAKEESGYDVELGVPLVTSTFTDATGERPYKAVRILYTATVVGGTLGTLEVGGTTDRAEWRDLDRVAEEPRADVVRIGIRAWRDRVR